MSSVLLKDAADALEAIAKGLVPPAPTVLSGIAGLDGAQQGVLEARDYQLVEEGHALLQRTLELRSPLEAGEMARAETIAIMLKRLAKR